MHAGSGAQQRISPIPYRSPRNLFGVFLPGLNIALPCASVFLRKGRTSVRVVTYDRSSWFSAGSGSTPVSAAFSGADAALRSAIRRYAWKPSSRIHPSFTARLSNRPKVPPRCPTGSPLRIRSAYSTDANACISATCWKR